MRAPTIPAPLALQAGSLKWEGTYWSRRPSHHRAGRPCHSTKPRRFGQRSSGSTAVHDHTGVRVIRTRESQPSCGRSTSGSKRGLVWAQPAWLRDSGSTRIARAEPENSRSLRAEFAKTPAWSCGESNPGPRASNQVFSGCSPCCRFSRPRGSHGHVPDRLSHGKVPLTLRDAEWAASLLDDARTRDGDRCPD